MNELLKMLFVEQPRLHMSVKYEYFTFSGTWWNTALICWSFVIHSVINGGEFGQGKLMSMTKQYWKIKGGYYFSCVGRTTWKVFKQLSLVNPSNHTANQYCDIPTNMAVVKALVVAVAVAVTVVSVDGWVWQCFECCGESGIWTRLYGGLWLD